MNETYIIPTVDDNSSIFPAYDDTVQLSEEKERKKREGWGDDIIAMQAAVCCLIAASLIILNVFYSDVTGKLFNKLCELTKSSEELLINPIKLLISLFDK